MAVVIVVRRPRKGKTMGSEGSARLLVYVGTCFVCGALVDKRTPWQVGIHWGDVRVPPDEVPVSNVASVVQMCHACYHKLVELEHVECTRGQLHMILTRIVGEGKYGVRHDKLIGAWGHRQWRSG